MDLKTADEAPSFFSLIRNLTGCSSESLSSSSLSFEFFVTKKTSY